MTSLLWFRRDLRLSDNPALVAAAQEGDVVGFFVVDPRLQSAASSARLVVRSGDPADVVPAVAREVEASTVHAAADFGPYGVERDEAVKRAGAVQWNGSPYAVAPGTVRTAAGSPYQVFTPFSRAWRAVGWNDPVRAPAGVSWVDGVSSSSAWPSKEPACDASLPDAGEAAAKRAARRFFEGPLADDAEARGRPADDATSRLSPHLKFGTIHPRQLLAKLGRSKAHDRFRTELCWREFYADVLHARPDSARRSYRPELRSMPLDTGPSADRRFEAWADGRTGFPYVDAGMRQLRAEAWMHNRLRMVTASFLVKDLHLDWTRGARHLMRLLVDGDLASNQHGWQWTAGTGTDAAPYFRIFNPVTQGERFDRDGAYVRRWVPELRAVPDRWAHRPRASPAGPPAGYPAPIVDHAEEREEALRRYGVARGGS